MKTLELVADQSGERVDAFIARRCPDLTRSRVKRLIDDGLVSLGGRLARSGGKIQAGDAVTVTLPPDEAEAPAPEDIPVTIIYRDTDVLVLDKPAGLTVHPAPGHSSGTLVNALLSAHPELADVGDTFRPGIVHRLDKDTSGLMVIARNDNAMQSLQRQLKDREVKKTYLALVRGVPDPRAGTIDAPIGRDPRNRKKMAVVAGGRESVTEYKVSETLRGNEFALLEVHPVSGRTHQIRVHLAAVGHPVVGDVTYGRRSDIVGRQFLHAWRLAFHTPSGNRLLEFEAPLPDELHVALDVLRSP